MAGLAGGLPAAAQAPALPSLADGVDAVAQVRAWIGASGDSHGRPYAIVDKTAAAVFLFDAEGRQLGATAVLLGLASGDVSEPGIGDLKLSAIEPAVRVTPAGRFVASLGLDGGHRVLWVDYASGIALHPVVTSNPRERRVERLRSPTPSDHRITYGCINVPAAFFDEIVQPAFQDGLGVVYVLPEARPLGDVFPGLMAQARRGEAADAVARGDAGR
jgi:hypothetical protein